MDYAPKPKQELQASPKKLNRRRRLTINQEMEEHEEDEQTDLNIAAAQNVDAESEKSLNVSKNFELDQLKIEIGHII